MSAEQTEQLVRRYFQSPSGDFFAPDAELHDMSQLEPLRGREEIAAFLRMFLGEAFPAGRYEVQAVIAAGDAAAVEWTFRGVNTGRAMGGPSTGRAVEFSGVSVYRVRDGHIVRARVYYDTGQLAEQLGLTGPRVPSAERERWYQWWREGR